jgi:hypothetical protein
LGCPLNLFYRQARLSLASKVYVNVSEASSASHILKGTLGVISKHICRDRTNADISAAASPETLRILQGFFKPAARQGFPTKMVGKVEKCAFTTQKSHYDTQNLPKCAQQST